MVPSITENFNDCKVILWANITRLNNLLIIINISMFFLTGLVAKGYFYTFFSISCFAVVAILTLLPIPYLGRLWFYSLNLLFELVGIYFFIASIVFWVRSGAQLGL